MSKIRELTIAWFYVLIVVLIISIFLYIPILASVIIAFAAMNFGFWLGMGRQYKNMLPILEVLVPFVSAAADLSDYNEEEALYVLHADEPQEIHIEHQEHRYLAVGDIFNAKIVFDIFMEAHK
jgi:ABC-type sugar transport system permease subunit